VALLAVHHRRVPLVRLGVVAAFGCVLAYFAAPAFMRLYLQRLANTSYLFAASDTILSGRISSWRALLDFLAEALQVPGRRCVLVSGETSRQKRVRIESPDRSNAERVLASWLQTSS